MKRFFGIALIVAFFAVQALAQDFSSQEEWNFEQAGSSLRDEANNELAGIAVDAEEYLQMRMIKYDKIEIGKQEFVILERYVDLFFETKAGYDERLRLYGLKTEMQIDSDLVTIVRTYFTQRFPAYQDDSSGTIRRIIARKIGLDVAIRNGFERSYAATLAYAVVSLFLFLFGFILSKILDESAIPFACVSVFVVLFWLYYLFWG